MKILNFVHVIFCEINRCLLVTFVSLGMAMLELLQCGDTLFTQQQILFLSVNTTCLTIYGLMKFVEQAFNKYKKSGCFVEWMVIILFYLILQWYGGFHKMPYSAVKVEYVLLFYGCVVLFKVTLEGVISLWEEKRNES